MSVDILSFLLPQLWYVGELLHFYRATSDSEYRKNYDYGNHEQDAEGLLLVVA